MKMCHSIGQHRIDRDQEAQGKSQMWTLLLNRLSLLHAVQDHTQSDDGIIDNCMPWFTGYHYTVSISNIKKNIYFHTKASQNTM